MNGKRAKALRKAARKKTGPGARERLYVPEDNRRKNSKLPRALRRALSLGSTRGVYRWLKKNA